MPRPLIVAILLLQLGCGDVSRHDRARSLMAKHGPFSSPDAANDFNFKYVSGREWTVYAASKKEIDSTNHLKEVVRLMSEEQGNSKIEILSSLSNAFALNEEQLVLDDEYMIKDFRVFQGSSSSKVAMVYVAFYVKKRILFIRIDHI